jgi:hypothetical protein
MLSLLSAASMSRDVCSLLNGTHLPPTTHQSHSTKYIYRVNKSRSTISKKRIVRIKLLNSRPSMI